MKKSPRGYAQSNSLKPAPIIQLVLIGVAALAIGSVGHYLQKNDTNASPMASAPSFIPAEITKTLQKAATLPPIQAIVHAGSSAATAINAKPEIITREVVLESGQTFAAMLTDAGIAQPEAVAAMNALNKAHDLRKMRSGQTINLTVSRSAKAETFISARFLPDSTKEVTISRTDDGTFTATAKAIPLEHRRLAASGKIRTTLYEAGDRAGIPHAVMSSFIRIYAHEVDFQRDIHPGDSFEIMYDQSTTIHGKAVGDSTITYASLTIGDKVKQIYRVTFNDGTVDYFNANGHSIRRALLRTPVAAARVTSSFGMRVHPLLGYSMMHKGVDFGAPVGTPIFAAGNGTVDEIGFKNGYGRYIRIRHNGTISTAYAHMNRFNTNLYRGSRVNQGQVIGYVGMSGRATGPHLHFEVMQNNRQVNPMSVNMPAGRVLEGKLLTLFKQGQGAIRQEFEKYVKAGDGKVVSVTLPAALNAGKNLTTACNAKKGC